MRKDMAQLLVDRPRRHRGETYRHHRRARNHGSDLPLKQGMRQPYVDRKTFNEYFPPLRGFLRKNCGRLWDKVFSELNAALSGGGTVIEHVKLHLLRDFVILEPLWHEGVPCYPYHRHGHMGEEPIPIDGKFLGGYYVDRSGLLQQAPRTPRSRYRKPKLERIAIDDHCAYQKIRGAWFRVWSKPLPAPAADTASVYDVVLKKWVKCRGITRPYCSDVIWNWYVDGSHGLDELYAAHGSLRVAHRKEQISKRTIRREKLSERLR